MNKPENLSKDRFQLANTHSPIKITVGDVAYPLEARLHLLNYERGALINLLYLTSPDRKQKGWLVGFDSGADKLCKFNTKEEAITALECFINVISYVKIYDSQISLAQCRELLETIKNKSVEEAEEALRQLLGILSINFLVDDNILTGEHNASAIEGHPTLRLEGGSFKLTLGRIDITGSLLTFYRIGGQNIGEDTVLIKLNARAHTTLVSADYNDGVLLQIDVGRKWETLFVGMIQEAHVEDNNEKISLICKSDIIALEDVKLQGMFCHNVEYKRVAYFLLRSAGWKPEKLHFEGLDFTGKHPYSISVIIQNIEAREPFGVGDIEFVLLERETKKRLESANLDLGKNWEQKVWARTYVTATDFYDTQACGLANVDSAIDLMTSLKCDSRPFVFLNGEVVPINWCKSDGFPNIKRGPWVYIDAVGTESFILNNLDTVNVHEKLEVGMPFMTRLNEVENIQVLLQKPLEKRSDQERGIVYALHWLRRAWDVDNQEDKLIYLWNAIEFIVAGAKLPRLFKNGELESIKKSIEHIDFTQLISSVEEDNAVLKTRRIQEVVDNVIKQLNDPPLMMKLSSLRDKANTNIKVIDKNAVSINDNEWEVIEKSRRKRNELIHGKSAINFDEEEANKLAYIVGKIITGLLVKG